MQIVGGKTASSGEMFRELTPKAVEVSDGFAITAAGYWLSNAGEEGLPNHASHSQNRKTELNL